MRPEAAATGYKTMPLRALILLMLRGDCDTFPAPIFWAFYGAKTAKIRCFQLCGGGSLSLLIREGS